MDKCAASSWPEGKKYWKDRRTENLQRALKQIADIAFLIFNKHALESRPEEATDVRVETYLCWLLRTRVSQRFRLEDKP